jgi:hypothetical protein
MRKTTFDILSRVKLDTVPWRGEGFKKVEILERNHSYECDQPEMVNNLSKNCNLCKFGCRQLKEHFSELDLSILLDSKKGIGQVSQIITSLTQLKNRLTA